MGWLPGEKPPAQYLNWWNNLVYQWCSYLRNLVGEALSWTARQTFSGGITVPASTPASTDAVQRVEMDAALAAESSARQGQDNIEGAARVNAITTEANARAAGDATEAAARVAGDALLTPLPTWGAYPANQAPYAAHGSLTPQLALDSLGYVLNRGAILVSNTAGATICTFPVGKRPVATVTGKITMNAAGANTGNAVTWTVTAAGVLTIDASSGAPGPNTYIPLEGLRWHADV